MMNRGGRLLEQQEGLSHGAHNNGVVNAPAELYPHATESQSHPNLQQGMALTGFRSDTAIRRSGENPRFSHPGAQTAGVISPSSPARGSGMSPLNGGQYGNTAMGMAPGTSAGIFQNPMLQPGQLAMGQTGVANPMLNCLATLISNIIQTRKGYQNNNCGPANCPVPFIIRKVKPCQKKKRCQARKSICQPSSCCCQPSSCSSHNNNCNNNPNSCYQTKIRTVKQNNCGCQPKPCCCKSKQPPNCPFLGLGPQRQELGTTNPFDNNIAPILLVQGGRCQTIQIADIGCKCNAKDNGKRRSSTSSSSSTGKHKGKKRRRAKSASSSKTSSSASGGSDDSESDDD